MKLFKSRNIVIEFANGKWTKSHDDRYIEGDDRIKGSYSPPAGYLVHPKFDLMCHRNSYDDFNVIALKTTIKDKNYYIPFKDSIKINGALDLDTLTKVINEFLDNCELKKTSELNKILRIIKEQLK